MAQQLVKKKKTFTYKFSEEQYGWVSFEADNFEEAQKLFNKVVDCDMSEEELPNFFRKVKSGECDMSDLEEVSDE